MLTVCANPRSLAQHFPHQKYDAFEFVWFISGSVKSAGWSDLFEAKSQQNVLYLTDADGFHLATGPLATGTFNTCGAAAADFSKSEMYCSF